MSYLKHLSEPWFTLIKLGIKTVEGRLNKGAFKEMKVGDVIIFYNEDITYRQIWVKIVEINNYQNFDEYLRKERLKKCLPGYTKIKDGLEVYYKYFSKEDEMKYKVKAFKLELIKYFNFIY